jgi:hypothetical protein
LFPEGKTTGVCPLLGYCGGPRRRRRIMDDETVELLGHHRCLCAQLSFGSAGGSHGSNCRTESCYRSNGGRVCPYHCAGGSASVLPACFRSFLLSFPRRLYTGSSVSGNGCSETVRKGYEQRSERGFGRYTERKMDRKATPWRPLRLRWERLRDFSDSLSAAR